jgi:GTP-binding protein LepA
MTLRAKVIDSWFEPRRGVICLIRVLSGELLEGDRIGIIEPTSDNTEHSVGKDHYSTQEVGIVAPHRIRTGSLSRGMMGYVVAGMRDPRDARPGAVLTLQKNLPSIIGQSMYLPKSAGSGVMGQHSVLYASVHPMEGDGFDELEAAVNRLALNDTGLEIQRTAGSQNSGGGAFLGPGLRVGFQGLLHVEVFRQRLLDEFDMEAIVTPPKVPYTIQFMETKSFKRAPGLPTEEVIEDLIQWPPQGSKFQVLEPVVDVRILAPMEYAGDIMELSEYYLTRKQLMNSQESNLMSICQVKRKRGTKMETKPIDENTWMFKSSMPWADVVTDFHDELKSLSTGFASFDVSEADPPQQKADLVKIDIMLNSEIVDPLAFVCHRSRAPSEARIVCERLQKVLPRQQFVTIIQARADGKIIASERIRAYRKDVLTTGGSKAVGGGDITRKKKLLEKQKKGKKRQQTTGKVSLSQAAFNSVISRSGT